MLEVDEREGDAALAHVRGVIAEGLEQARRGELLDGEVEQPGTGHHRDDLVDEELRFWAVYSQLIVYRPNTESLQVIRVLHSARDGVSILEPGGDLQAAPAGAAGS